MLVKLIDFDSTHSKQILDTNTKNSPRCFTSRLSDWLGRIANFIENIFELRRMQTTFPLFFGGMVVKHFCVQVSERSELTCTHF
jgi:hypothetical protein